MTRLPAGITTEGRRTEEPAAGTSSALHLPVRPETFSQPREEPSFRRHTMTGSLIGAGVGLVVGVLAHRNDKRKCDSCSTDMTLIALGVTGGNMLGFAFGGLTYLAHKEAWRKASAR